MAIKEIRMPNGKYNYNFDHRIEPVVHIESGETVVVYTEDGFGGLNNDRIHHLQTELNPLTGPIFVNGAEPGDSLKITIISIEPTREWGASCLLHGIGALVPNNYTIMPTDSIPEKVYIYKFANNNTELKCDNLLSFPYEPCIGTIGTAPEDEAKKSTATFNQGGNIDVPDVSSGNILYLPIAVTGAYLSLGDVHAKQGDGELCGVSIEMPAKVSLKIEVVKGKTIKCPRVESPTEIMSIGSCKPMDDAARMAYHELIGWMVELGWEDLIAYQTLSQCGKLHVGNMVNSSYSLVAKVDKEVAYRTQHK